MAGLKFDPNRTLNSTDSTTSVPPVVDEYLTPLQKAQKNYQQQMTKPWVQKVVNYDPTVSSIPQLSSEAMQNAQDALNWISTTDPETRNAEMALPQTNANGALERWQKGYAGLDDEEKQAFLDMYQSKLARKDDKYLDRVWRNLEYINTFGQEDYDKYSSSAERDERLLNKLTEDAIKTEYDGNKNLSALLNLSPQGRLDLLESDYKPDKVLDYEKSKYEDMSELNIVKGAFTRDSDNAKALEDWEDLSMKERLTGLKNQVAQSVSGGVFTGTTLGGGIGTKAGGFKGAILGSLAGAIYGGIYGAVYGTLEGLENPKEGLIRGENKKAKNNQAILDNIIAADNERLKDTHSKEIDDYYGELVDNYLNGEYTEEQINNDFDDIALTQNVTTTDELGFVHENKHEGSSYYSAFKGRDELEGLGTYNKLKYIAQSRVLASEYGANKAIQILNQDIGNTVSEAQSPLKWSGHTIRTILVGGTANLGMNVVGAGALAAYATYGTANAFKEATNNGLGNVLDAFQQGGRRAVGNYLQGKDASGNGASNSNFSNPQYWNKVDEYNVLRPSRQQMIDDNGGISPWTNIYPIGTEDDFVSWSTLNEMLGMTKFYWSEGVKNWGLGKLLNLGTTLISKGATTATGVATEAGSAAQWINKWGNRGIVATSSLGIDAAYGMQTYNQVLDTNKAKLEELIDIDTEKAVEDYFNSPEALEEFEHLVEKENERRRKAAEAAGPEGKYSYVPVDRQKAWNDYTANVIAKEREKQANYADKREAAARANDDAALAYIVDASVEALRMAATNAAFRSYLFDRGTLNAARINNPYAETVYDGNKYALAKNAETKKAIEIASANLYGGFHSNYFDDVTVGLAEAIGIQDYNNYLLTRYNPAMYGSVLDDYLNPFVAGVAGAGDAMLERRSFLDGVIGLGGSAITVAPNAKGMLSRKENMTKIAREIEEAEHLGVSVPKFSAIEKMSDFIGNPILEAIAQAKETTRMTQLEIDRVNKQSAENKGSVNNMAEAIAAIDQKDRAIQTNDSRAIHDAKDREAFTAAKQILDMRHSAIVTNAHIEVDKSTWSKKKKVADAIARALNALLGEPYYEYADTPYVRAMQALEDAVGIDQMSEYYRDRSQVTEEQIDADPEVARNFRQSTLINDFLAQPINKSVVEGMSDEQKVQFAKERLKKNAQELLDMMNMMEDLNEKFTNSIAMPVDPEGMAQLMYQYVLDSRYKTRLLSMESDITGKPIEEDFDTWFRNKQQSTDKSKTQIAKYGSIAGYEKALKEQQKHVESAENTYNSLVELSKQGQVGLNLREGIRQKQIRNQAVKKAKKALALQKNILKQMESERQSVTEAWKDNVPVISAEDILNLNPEDRVKILDDFYRNDYSQEQQQEIDRAKTLLIKDGTSLNDALQKVVDVAILQQRIDENMAAAKVIMQNPDYAKTLVESARDNRDQRLLDYFNDKVVAEGFADFLKDKRAVTSKDKVVKKAKGYSTAVLFGIAKMTKQMLDGVREDPNASDIVLTNIYDGIADEIDSRIVNNDNLFAMSGYVQKTNKLSHIEETVSDASVAERKTSQRELSRNDKALLEAAIQYASDRQMKLEDLAEGITGTEKAYNNFLTYLEEYNRVRPGSKLTMQPVALEDRVSPESADYMKSLLQDAVNSFEEYREIIKESAKPKETTTATSVATTTPEVTVTPEPQPKAKSNPEEAIPEAESTVTNAERNAGIINSANAVNPKIASDVETLLNEIDTLDTSDDVKNNLKTIIEDLISSNSYDNIEELQKAIYSGAVTYDTATNHMAAIINKKTIRPTRKAQVDQSVVAPPFQDNPRLTSIDLNSIVDNPNRKAMSDYAKEHHIPEFLNKLSEVWDKVGKHILVNFVYDPSLAEGSQENKKVREEIEAGGHTYIPSQSAPVLMAIEVNDEIRPLIDDNSQLIKVRITTSGKKGGEYRFYQPIGFMPDVNNTDPAYASTASKMSTIREQIQYTETIRNEEVPITEPTLIRYNNKTEIRSKMEAPSVHTEESSLPRSGQNVPWKNVSTLMEENMQSSMEALVTADDSAKRAYQSAKRAGGETLRNNPLYKTMRAQFIKGLTVEEIPADDPEVDTDVKRLVHPTYKGGRDSYNKPIWILPIGRTYDRNGSGILIVDMLRNISRTDTPDTALGKAINLLDSNSRFRKLFDALNSIKFPKGLYNSDGSLAVSADTAAAKIEDFNKLVNSNIGYSFRIYEPSVKSSIEQNADGQPMVKVDVYSGNELLSSLHMDFKGGVSEVEFANFVKDLILDREGNTRRSPRETAKYESERVKWQVNYNNAEVIKPESEASSSEKTKAREDLEQLYDDGVLQMNVTKLNYTPKSVSVTLTANQLQKLGIDRSKVDKPTTTVTGDKANFEADTATGKADADTGVITEGRLNEGISDILSAIPQKIKDAVVRMIQVSQNRKPSDENNKVYNIDGESYARVTSIKSAMPKGPTRFNEKSGWALPSTQVGNSFDRFGRDVSNHVFDKMTDEEKDRRFNSYDNSTKENYRESYKALKAFEGRLLAKGQVIIATGDLRNPGNITPKGLLNVVVNNGGQLQRKQVRVAGTVDLIAIDRTGKLHIYDFKTHRVEKGDEGSFTKDDAIAKGYDRQLSMYAKFIEDEFGLEVASINLIPVKAYYPVPQANVAEGEHIANSEKQYRKVGRSNQLEMKDIGQSDAEYVQFTGADYEVQQEFELPRLKGNELDVSFDKMTDDEKSAIIEATVDQSDDVNSSDDITLKSTEVEQEYDDFDDEDLDDFEKAKRQEQKAGGKKVAESDALTQINPEGSLKEKLDEVVKNCGGKKLK